MPASFPQARGSQEVSTLDRVRLSPARARLAVPEQSQGSPAQSQAVSDSPLERLAKAVESSLTDVHGSAKAAAIEIGNDRSQIRRQLQLGTFDLRQMAAGGETFLAKLGEELIAQFGTARKSKKQIARERLPELIGLFLDATEEL